MDPYCGVWVTGFRMAPVPCMGTNSLFTRGPFNLDPPSLAYGAYEEPASKAGRVFEYLSCGDWERLRTARKEAGLERDFRTESYGRPSDLLSPSESSLAVPGSSEADQRVVHLIVPDGEVQGTQLAHHLVSTMLCQNPQLFHPNAVQSVLAAVLVYLLKQPFKSDGWCRRQLEWVSASYECAYASSTCSGAAGEHKRFEAYMTSLMDQEEFRASLITDADDHPRELRCQGLSKAVLGMWLKSRCERLRGSVVSEALLEHWRLGLMSEFFHRLGLSLEVQVASRELK